MLFIAEVVCFMNTLEKIILFWKFHSDLLFGHDMTVIVYALITMHVSILIFLSHFPERWFSRLIYILIWSGVYSVVEWILFVFGRISYQNGWGIWYSFLFDLGMFSLRNRIASS